MYVTSLLLLERAQYLCLQRKTGPSSVLEHCYKIFLLGRSKEQETLPSLCPQGCPGFWNHSPFRLTPFLIIPQHLPLLQTEQLNGQLERILGLGMIYINYLLL